MHPQVAGLFEIPEHWPTSFRTNLPSASVLATAHSMSVDERNFWDTSSHERKRRALIWDRHVNFLERISY